MIKGVNVTREYNFKKSDEKNYHEIANLLPLMEGNPFREMARDIFANGLMEPIILLDNKILDGRNRYRACRLAKVKPEFVDWQGKGSPIDFVYSTNLMRRNLGESQRAMIAAELATSTKGGDRSKG